MPQGQVELNPASLAAAMDFERLRADFPIFTETRSPLHYLDSAASAHKPDRVIDAVERCYRQHYGPVHRGLYPLAEQASAAYEAARKTLAEFVHAATADQIVFTRSATEAINLVASGWAGPRLRPGDQIWVSQMEHHSNFLPWQRVCRESGAQLRIIPLDDQGHLELSRTEGLFDDNTRLIAITQVSNVLGAVNPIRQITERARARNIAVLVDAAQSVGHMPVDVAELDCDFLAASAHKMCGPTGIGFLYGKTERLAETEPLLLGGGMVDLVSLETSSWAGIPARFEAGSPNLAGAIGWAAAVDYLDQIGTEAIEQYVHTLTDKAAARLASIDGVRVYGSNDTKQRGGILSFTIDDIHPHDIGQVAGEHGVAIRAGHHCCQPLMQHLGVSSTARASFYIYNNEQDIDALEHAIHAAIKIFSPR